MFIYDIAVFDLFRDYVECERPGLHGRLFGTGAVHRDSRQLRDITDPAPVRRTKQPYRELHLPNGA